MKKYFKVILLFLLLGSGLGAIFSPFGEAFESTNTNRVWSYTLYNRIFGEGTSKNVGALTLAWCLNLFALLAVIVLIVLYFAKIYPTKRSLIIFYGAIAGLFGVGSIIDFCACPIIGNTTDATLGIGTILTAIFLALGFLIAIAMLFVTLKSNDD